jgi:hypothetical protein
MEILRIIWIINFFFFLLILFYLWSKISLILKKNNELIDLLKKCDDLNNKIAELYNQNKKI